MSNIWNIASKGLLVTGISGFPVGVSSFAHSSKFSNNKQITAQKIALEQSTKFLEEAKIKSEEKETYEKNIDKEVKELQIKAENIESSISQGSGDAAKNASAPLRKLIKRGMHFCEGRDKEGLIQVTEKIKFGDKEQEITYCYYSECDGQLFLKNNFDEFTGSDDYLYQTAGEGCFNINLKKGDDKIEGTIKFGFKSKPVKNRSTHPDKKNGILFKTKLEFHKNNNEADKFTNTVIYLVSNAANLEWKRQGDVKTWEDSNKNRYTYESIKDKFKKQEYKELDFWTHDSSLSGTGKKIESLTNNMVQKYLGIFDKGSDLWNWSKDNIEGKEYFKFRNEDNVILKFVNSNQHNPGFWWKKSLE